MNKLDYENAIALGGLLFSPVRTPDKLCKYFSCLPNGAVDKTLVTEYMAFRVFILDYSLYAFMSSQKDYAQFKGFLFDTFITEFWNDLYKKDFLSSDISILNDRLPVYARIYSSDAPYTEKRVRFCCAELLKQCGYKQHLDANSGEYCEFVFDFCLPATLAFIKTIKEAVDDSNNSHNGNKLGYLLLIIIVIAVLYFLCK